MYKKTLTSNFCAHFHLQNVTSNNKIHREFFEELHRKGGAKCKYEVFMNASRSFRVSTSGAGRGNERGGGKSG